LSGSQATFLQEPDLIEGAAALLVPLDRILMERLSQLGSPCQERIFNVKFERHITSALTGAGNSGSVVARTVDRCAKQVQAYEFDVEERNSSCARAGHHFLMLTEGVASTDAAGVAF
jgi:hypothetical protein